VPDFKIFDFLIEVTFGEFIQSLPLRQPLFKSMISIRNLSLSACTVCPKGEAITLPNTNLRIPGFDFVDDCLTLSQFAPLLSQNSSECNLIHTISSLCGCSTRQDACHLCPDKSKAVYGQRYLPFLSEMFGGISPTCELIEAGLQTYSYNDGFCQTSQQLISEYCGCSAEKGSKPIEVEEAFVCRLCALGDSPIAEKEIQIEGFPLRTCGQLSMATETLYSNTSLICPIARQLYTHCGCATKYQRPCAICGTIQSYEVPFPDRIIDPSLTSPLFPGLSISCQVLADVAYGIPSREELPLLAANCAALQGLGTECGCSMPKETSLCNICSHPLDTRDYQDKAIILPGFDQATCRFAELAAPFLQDGDKTLYEHRFITFDCRYMKSVGFFCGCNDGIFVYWGADTLSKQIAVVWIQRITAMMSICGSLAIILQVSRRKSSDKSRIYYRIVFALSLADILSSIAWGLGPLPTSYDFKVLYNLDRAVFNEKAYALRYYGSYGNEVTCKIQGFVLHLGFMSILFNASLSYFYKLSVLDGFRDRQFTLRYHILLVYLPACIGICVAIAAIHFVTFTPLGCMVGSHRDKGGWMKLMYLFYAPYGPSFIYVPLNTMYIYWKVRMQRKAGNRWNLSARANANSNRSLNTESENSSMRYFSVFRGLRRYFSNRLERPHTSVLSRLERNVFWQSVWYVVAFLASYTIFAFVFAIDGYEADSYPLFVLLSFLTPMQGFFNFLVFFRTRISVVVANIKSGMSERVKELKMKAYQLMKGLFAWLRHDASIADVDEKCDDYSQDQPSRRQDNFVHSSVQPIDLLYEAYDNGSHIQEVEIRTKANDANSLESFECLELEIDHGIEMQNLEELGNERKDGRMLKHSNFKDALGHLIGLQEIDEISMHSRDNQINHSLMGMDICTEIPTSNTSSGKMHDMNMENKEASTLTRKREQLLSSVMELPEADRMTKKYSNKNLESVFFTEMVTKRDQVFSSLVDFMSEVSEETRDTESQSHVSDVFPFTTGFKEGNSTRREQVFSSMIEFTSDVSEDDYNSSGSIQAQSSS
jgi:hypothetical protein